MSDLASQASRTVVRFIDFYALLSGITAIRTDFVRKRILHSRLRSIYAICVNLLFAAGIPFIIQYDMDMPEGFFHDSNSNVAESSLVLMAGAACVIMSYVMICWMLIFRRRHERLYEGMALEFFALDRAYFDKVPAQVDIERRLGLLLLAKAISIFVHILSIYISLLYMIDNWTVMTIIDIFYYVQVYSMAHSRVFNFLVCVAEAYKRFQLLNGQLEKLLQKVQIMHAYAATVLHVDGSNVQQFQKSTLTELGKISRAHWRLTHLVQRICNIFDAQIVAILLTFTLHNIVSAFLSMLIMDGTMNTEYGMVINSLQIVASCLVILDMFCLYRLCEATANAQQRTGEILRAFQTMPPMDVAFERCSERLSLQLLQNRLDISMGGMFSLNRETLLALLAFILTHIAILVQFDLELRLRHLAEGNLNKSEDL